MVVRESINLGIVYLLMLVGVLVLWVGLASYIARDANRNDQPGWMWGLLAFVFPLAGWIAWFVARRSCQKNVGAPQSKAP